MNRKALIIGFVTLLALSTSLMAQFPQMEKMCERMDTSERATAEREREECENGPAKPKYPPARMNIDVQMVLAKAEYKNFTEAKLHADNHVLDGDPLWLYVKFNGVLERYVYTMKEADGRERYILFAEYGPEGDVTAKSHYWLEFTKDDLKLTELKMSLSPGKAGHNLALPIYMHNIVNSRPGRWNNELRLTNVYALPRGLTDHLAKVGFACDFSKGLAKYPKMLPTFQSMVLRDTTDESRWPIEGKFQDMWARTELTSKLGDEGIAPSRVYFAGDDWAEYSDLPNQVRQKRSVTGVFLYRKENACFYGTAELVQDFDAEKQAFGPSQITLKKDIPTPCVNP